MKTGGVLGAQSPLKSKFGIPNSVLAKTNRQVVSTTFIIFPDHPFLDGTE
jgi:hypothetical protein